MPVAETFVQVAVKNIAIATDFTQCTERALEHGMAVARHFGSSLHVLHLVRPSAFPFSPDMIPALDDAAVRDCDQLIDRLRKAHQLDGIDLHQHVLQGEIHDLVGDFVRRQRIDLMVVGTHGRSGIPRLLHGSAAQQIFHSVRCPVLVVGPRSPGAGPRLQLRRILFCTDLSRESLAAVPYVVTAMRMWHTGLDVLHVCAEPQSEHSRLMSDLRSRFDDLLDGSGETAVRCHLLTGKPAPCVLQFAHDNREDLIVFGLKAHLYSGPLWAHAYEIVRHAECPVLSIRTPPSPPPGGNVRGSAEW